MLPELAPSRIWTHEIQALAQSLGASKDESALELRRKNTVRTFACAPFVVRTDSAKGVSIAAEVMALRTLASALAPRATPPIIDYGEYAFECGSRPYLAYHFVEGQALSAEAARPRLGDIADTYARLHGAHVMDLLTRFPRQTSMSLLDPYKRASERLRAWLLAREEDGLAQDALTECLLDVQRRLRGFVIAREHSFLSSRKRVLCHGSRSAEHIIVRNDGALWLVGFQNSSLGDAAHDLANVTRALALSDDEEDRFLNTYFDTREHLFRPTRRFLSRYFARKTVGYFADVARGLNAMRLMKSRGFDDNEDIVVAVENEIENTQKKLLACLKKVGSASEQQYSLGDVKSLGRMAALEDVLVKGRVFRVAITGLPYAGKTEVASVLARRLSHTYLNTSALARAVALFARRQKDEDALCNQSLPEQVRAFFASDFTFAAQSESPFYRVRFGDDDVTQKVHESEDRLAAARIFDDEDAFRAFADALRDIIKSSGVVVEGYGAEVILSGRVTHFHISADTALRVSRLMNHRGLDDESDAASLLERLDETHLKPGDEAYRRVDVSLEERSAGQASLLLLNHLLPAHRRRKGGR